MFVCNLPQVHLTEICQKFVTFKIAFRGVEFQLKHHTFYIHAIVCNSNLIFLIKMNPINQLQKETLPLLQQGA